MLATGARSRATSASSRCARSTRASASGRIALGFAQGRVEQLRSPARAAAPAIRVGAPARARSARWPRRSARRPPACGRAGSTSSRRRRPLASPLSIAPDASRSACARSPLRAGSREVGRAVGEHDRLVDAVQTARGSPRRRLAHQAQRLAAQRDTPRRRRSSRAACSARTSAEIQRRQRRVGRVRVGAKPERLGVAPDPGLAPCQGAERRQRADGAERRRDAQRRHAATRAPAWRPRAARTECRRGTRSGRRRAAAPIAARRAREPPSARRPATRRRARARGAPATARGP